MKIYAMVDDDGIIHSVLRLRAGNLDAIRDGGEWRDPTLEELDGSDDMSMYEMTEDFLPAYDRAQASSDHVAFEPFAQFEAARDA